MYKAFFINLNKDTWLSDLLVFLLKPQTFSKSSHLARMSSLRKPSIAKAKWRRKIFCDFKNKQLKIDLIYKLNLKKKMMQILQLTLCSTWCEVWVRRRNCFKKAKLKTSSNRNAFNSLFTTLSFLSLIFL